MATKINMQMDDIKICSINVNGISKRNHLLLDKYTEENSIKILAVQENLSCEKEKIKLTNTKTITDTNRSKNRGAVLYYVHNSIPSTNLVEISRLSKQIDSAWSLVVLENKRFIIRSIYM